MTKGATRISITIKRMAPHTALESVVGGMVLFIEQVMHLGG